MKVLLVLFLAVALAGSFSLAEEEFAGMEPVVPSSNLKPRITNGYPVNIYKYPYQVCLNVTGDLCGGSLISRTYVLTAAHCVDGASAENITVFLGSTIRLGGVRRVVRKKILHPGWDRNAKLNDIALLQIDPVSYSNCIRNVALPPISASYSTYDGNSAIATGWGETTYSRAEDILQGVTMRVISNSECAETFNSTIKSSHLCVSTPGGTSVCHGDSGGPLVLKRNKVLVGVTSWGSTSGCDLGLPTVFTRVTAYRQWIRDEAKV